uniref:Uncharacterized protein n=1 Tax=Parascaris univalens TaxID=6257 RepID=A0A915CH07_PARUN
FEELCCSLHSQRLQLSICTFTYEQLSSKVSIKIGEGELSLFRLRFEPWSTRMLHHVVVSYAIFESPPAECGLSCSIAICAANEQHALHFTIIHIDHCYEIGAIGDPFKSTASLHPFHTFFERHAGTHCIAQF